MQFLFQPLTWGFLLVGVPILVHLINMLRHRRQQWAAMDFLLESYRRNRRWVLLKQWLLLAARMLAMFLLVLMLARWVSGSQMLSWLGGQTTHHYILLDDSFSMAELEQNETAYNRGLLAAAGLVRSLAAAPGDHQITLVRWSRAALALQTAEEGLQVDAAADLLAQSVPQDPSTLLDRLNATEPVALQLAPEAPLELVAPLIAENSDQQSEVYLITDLRRNEFGEVETLRNQLLPLTQGGAELHVIDAGRAEGANLSVISIAPNQDIWAAGVPLMVQFQVRNRSATPARNVIVRIRSVEYAAGEVEPQVDQAYSGQVADQPPVVIDEIAPGETVTRRVQVVFATPGSHVVEVALPDDVLAADNRRWSTIQIQARQRVLLVDGDVRRTNAFFFEKVINPGSNLRTGMEVEVVDPSFLRDVAPEALAQFGVVALLDVPRIDEQGVNKLQEYCRTGGGLLFVAGPNTNLKFINEQLHRSSPTEQIGEPTGDQRGLFPSPVERILELNRSPATTGTELTVSEHPIWGPLLRLESSPFFSIRIRQLLELGRPADLQEDPAVAVIARGPGGRPLMLDHRLGEGHALLLLTGLQTEWSNWAQDPTFVVLVLQSFGYLGSFRRPVTSQPVGAPLEMMTVDQAVLPEAEVLIPPRDEGMRIRWQQKVDQTEAGDVAKLDLRVDLRSMDRDFVDNLLRPGVFETWMFTAQGERLVENAARNVPAAEGDLERVTHSELQQKLSGVPLEIQSAELIGSSGLSAPEMVHSALLLGLLALLLVGEQALAYSASYHAPATGADG